MKFKKFKINIWVFKLFSILELLVGLCEPQKIGSYILYTMKMEQLKTLCVIDCKSIEITSSLDSCTAIAAFSNNSNIDSDKTNKLQKNLQLPLVLIINHYAHDEVRQKMKPNPADENAFADEINEYIANYEADAIAFDNLYPDISQGVDDTWKADIANLFERVKGLKTCELIGLVVPKSKDKLTVNDIDGHFLNGVVDFYVVSTFTSNAKTTLSITTTVDEMHKTLDALSCNGYSLSNTIATIQILNPVPNPDCPSEAICSYSYDDKISIYFQEALDNLYQQGILAYNLNLCGVLIQSIDHDVAEDTCGYFPVTKIIADGVKGGNEPCDVISCLLSNSTKIPTTLSHGKDLSVLKRICAIGSASSEITTLPPNDLCTSFMTYTTNPQTVNKNSPLPDGDYKMIMFINDFSYSDIREKIRPINSDDFARIIKRTITQYKLVAIIFDNLYPTPDEGDDTYVEDMTKFFDTLHSVCPDALFGLAIPIDPKTLARKDVDISNFNKIVDFYLTKTYGYNQCKNVNTPDFMAITTPVDGLRETFKALGIAGFNLFKTVTLMHISINVIVDGKDVSEPIDDISYSDLCKCIPKSGKFCRDTLSNFYEKGVLVQEYGIFGICFVYMDRDDFVGSCECSGKYPVLQAIEAGTSGGPKPTELLNCDKLDFTNDD